MYIMHPISAMSPTKVLTCCTSQACHLSSACPLRSTFLRPLKTSSTPRSCCLLNSCQTITLPPLVRSGLLLRTLRHRKISRKSRSAKAFSPEKTTHLVWLRRIQMSKSLWIPRQQILPPSHSFLYSGLSFSLPTGSLNLILYSYSTSFEITLDIIGLVCAAGAGAAQVSITVNIEDISVDV
jgi:hypothetical protein